ncbi:N-acetylmuramoyl-L-alanine amidase [Marivita hallyeonensis]|uniref:N-acetylmuramoyl-L-alanine amidase n=1 Tax=Marivita hallyeonensis TaxID=996342 RepID=A0A1M5RC99_9RHOB|nr:N-acetylmuramoyl-L-alanine amidase [Marivita hallyeonensis]SHH23669.1 N-acetylmuramoyl-L-alanine amidase [Marivita hallyeonensis]
MSGVITRFLATFLAVICATPVLAQDLGALARFEVGSIEDRWGGAELRLELSQGVPWRVFTLTQPNRLVMDFREVQWGDVDTNALIAADRVTTLRVGGYRPGWSRLVAELAEPMAIDTAALITDDTTGRAVISVIMEQTDQAAFDAVAGAPREAGWDLPEPARVDRITPRDPNRLKIVLDPGHGGIDPGAERGEVREADLMLTFARELQEVLRRAGGFDVSLTRTGDYFVSLEARVARARDAGADIFISLHADALAEGEATGAAVYTLSDEASDAASEALAERHDRDDLLAGVDLSQSDDRVANVLMSLARQENAPRSEALAKHMLDGIQNAVGRVHKRPLRSAGFSVLKAADIPSVLLEVGFLSTDEDLKNLNDPIWRQGMAAGVRDGLIAWRDEDTALAPLRRK